MPTFQYTFSTPGRAEETISAAVEGYLSSALNETVSVAQSFDVKISYDRDEQVTWIRLGADNDGMDIINAAFKARPLDVSGARFVVPDEFFND
jgi:hypothetical protein